MFYCYGFCIFHFNERFSRATFTCVGQERNKCLVRCHLTLKITVAEALEKLVTNNCLPEGYNNLVNRLTTPSDNPLFKPLTFRITQ